MRPTPPPDEPPRAGLERARRWIRFAAPGTAWLLGAGVCHALRDRAALLAASLWGLLLLAAFVAWGASVSRALGRNERRGWGFYGALGMAVTLAFGGVSACVRAVSTRGIVAYCAAGVFAWGYGWARSADQRPLGASLVRAVTKRTHLLSYAGAALVLYAMMALQYCGSVLNADFNVWDDNMAYRAFARQFLDTGTLHEGFSYRRIGSYGGQSLLHAMVLALSDRDRLHIFDNGICALLIFGLVMGFRTHVARSARFGVLAVAMLAATLTHSPHNVASELSGVVFFLALFRLFDEPRFESAGPTGNAALAGLLAAGVCTLRQNYLPAGVGYVGLFYAALVAFPGTRRRSHWLRQGSVALLALLACLSPWMILSQISTHTVLYPLFKGNISPGFGIFGNISLAEEFRWTLANLFTLRPIETLMLFFVAAFALPMNRRNRALHVFLLCNISSFLLMMHFFRSFHDSGSINRYYLSFTVAFAFAAALRSMDAVAHWRRVPSGLVAFGWATVAMGIQFMDSRDGLRDLYTSRITSFATIWHQRGPAHLMSESDDLYRRLQASVPPKARILVMLDHTYLLDTARNDILHYDHPGAMGPPPGIPCFKGPEPWAAYMLSQNIRYVAYQLGPSSPEYYRPYWTTRLAIVIDPTGRNGFYKMQARFELDAFDVLEALTKTRLNVFREGEIRVLDLATLS